MRTDQYEVTPDVIRLMVSGLEINSEFETTTLLPVLINGQLLPCRSAKLLFRKGKWKILLDAVPVEDASEGDYIGHELFEDAAPAGGAEADGHALADWPEQGDV